MYAIIHAKLINKKGDTIFLFFLILTDEIAQYPALFLPHLLGILRVAE